MGRRARRRPRKLAKKLTEIRRRLGLPQAQMIRELGSSGLLQSHISGWELGTSEPDLLVLLRYARLAGISVETLIDDKLDL
jgi:transcriptional regulator with XRE-family HTH domain